MTTEETIAQHKDAIEVSLSYIEGAENDDGTWGHLFSEEHVEFAKKQIAFSRALIEELEKSVK